MFLRYQCGCIGFELVDETLLRRMAYCVSDCCSDGSDDSLDIFRRPALLDKDREPLGFDETVDLWHSIGTLMAEGFQFRKLKGLLGLRVLNLPSKL